MASATLPLNRGPYLSRRGGIWLKVFLLAALRCKPTGPFSPDLFSQAAFVPHKAQKTAKKMGRGGVQTTAQVLCSMELEMTF